MAVTDESKEWFIADQVRARDHRPQPPGRPDDHRDEAGYRPGPPCHHRPGREADASAVRRPAPGCDAVGLADRGEQAPRADYGSVPGDAEVYLPGLSVPVHAAGRASVLLVARRADRDRRRAE